MAGSAVTFSDNNCDTCVPVHAGEPACGTRRHGV